MRRLLPLLLIMALLAGCSGLGDAPTDVNTVPTNAPNAGEETVTISFAAWEYERKIYEQLAETFMAQNPNIKVVILPLDDLTNVSNPTGGPESSLAPLRRVVAGADSAPAQFVPPEAYGTNLLLNLKPLMEADASFKPDDYYPGALERYTAKDGLWVLPRYLYVQLLDYNKDLFKQAGLPEPKAGWSWEDLLGAADQLASKSGGSQQSYGYFDWSNGFLPLMALIQASNPTLFKTPPDQVQLNQPEVIAAIKRIRDLQEHGALFQQQMMQKGPAEGGDVQIDPQQLIRESRIAIWPSDALQAMPGPDGTPQPLDLSFQVGKVPYPATGNGIDYFGSGGEGYIISGGTAYPNETWKWIEFLSRQQVDQPNGGGAFNPPGRIPARKSLAEQVGFWADKDPSVVAAYESAIKNTAAPANPSSDQMSVGMISGALQQAFFQIVSDPKADPEQALEDAQRQLQEQIAQIQLSPTPTPDTSPVVVATPEPQEAPAGATTIRYGVWGSSPGDIRRLARSFREQHPDIFVQVAATDTFTGPVELKDIARTSDCFAWWSPPQTDADFAALLDLRPLLDADAAFPHDDYPPALLSAYERNGGLFGLPYAFNMRSLSYNRTLFDQSGQSLPSYQWKPDDFLAAAQALTSGEGNNKQYGYVPLSGPQNDLLFFVGQFGSRLTSGNGEDVRPNFDDPRVAEAIQWYTNLATVHKVMPEFKIPYKRDDQGYQDRSYELVQTGKAAMWFDYGTGIFGGPKGGPATDLPGGGGQPPFEVGMAALPIGGGGLRSTDISVRGFHISGQTQNAQACWEWLKFMSADLSNIQADLPARSSVATSDDFAARAQPGMVELYKVYADALKQPGQVGDNPNDLYGRMDLYWLFKAIDESIQGKQDLRAGLAEAQKLTTAYMECMANEKKPGTCANQVDPNYQGFSEDPQEGPIPIDIAPRG